MSIGISHGVCEVVPVLKTTFFVTSLNVEVRFRRKHKVIARNGHIHLPYRHNGCGFGIRIKLNGDAFSILYEFLGASFDLLNLGARAFLKIKACVAILIVIFTLFAMGIHMLLKSIVQNVRCFE
jgi:hypothetical protein